MKRKDIVSGIVERVDFPAKEIVRPDDNGGILSVKNVLPGQRVTCRVKKVRHGVGEGMLLSVDEKAPNEIAPKCPHFGECGGCTYLGLSVEDQLVLKEMQVKRLLDGVLEGRSEYSWEGIKSSPLVEGYRNKMEFTFGDEYRDGPLALGMHKRGSFYDIVTVKDCRIVDEDYRLILTETLRFFREREVSYYHRMRHEGYLRHLMVRKATYTGQIMVALVTTSAIDHGKNEETMLIDYTEMLRGLSLTGELKSVLHTVNDSLADVVASDRTDILWGDDYIEETLLGLRFKISEFSFFQTNSSGAEVLYSTAREYIKGTDNYGRVVYDLYSGTGTIAQLMADAAEEVIGVEIVEEAVEAARENAVSNGLHNCKFLTGDVLKVLDEIEEKPDFIILDPPRDGVHPKALKKIIDYGVESLVYISCKPTSLARDLEMFLDAGYDVKRAVAIDQFPGTSSIETVCLISKE